MVITSDFVEFANNIDVVISLAAVLDTDCVVSDEPESVVVPDTPLGPAVLDRSVGTIVLLLKVDVSFTETI